MKGLFKYVFISFFVLIIGYIGYDFISYNITPEKKLQRKSEEALKNQMNDPDSYEFVAFHKDVVFETLNRDSEYDYFILKFRGKNKMGGLILDEAIVKAKKYDEKDLNSDYIFIELLDE